MGRGSARIGDGGFAITEDISTFANGRLIKTPGRRPARRRHWARLVALVATVVVAVLVVGGVGYAQSRPDRVPDNTFVAGVPVGGLEAGRLTVVLATQVRPRVELPLAVTAGADQFELSARDLGVRLDVAATARALLATSTLRDRLPLLSRPRHDVAAQFTMNPAAAEAALDQRLDDGPARPGQRDDRPARPEGRPRGTGRRLVQPPARASRRASRAGRAVGRHVHGRRGDPVRRRQRAAGGDVGRQAGPAPDHHGGARARSTSSSAASPPTTPAANRG